MYMNIHISLLHVQSSVPRPRYVCMNIHINIPTYTSVQVFMKLHIYICAYVFTLYIHVHMERCMHLLMHVRAHVRMHVHSLAQI